MHLVIVRYQPDKICSNFDSCRLTQLYSVLMEEITDIVRENLRICRRSGAANVHIIRQLADLVRRPVGNIHPGAGPRVGAEDDAAVVGDADDGGAHRVGLVEVVEAGLHCLRGGSNRKP